MSRECNNLVDGYLQWLMNRINVQEINGICEITTPFLDRQNDRLQLYVERKNGSFRITDDSYILGDLEMCGCAVDTPHRKELLQTVLNGFGVRREGNELVVEANEASFPQKKHSLLQAMLAVNDLFIVSQSRISRHFTEDVGDFLESNEVRFAPSVEFTGKSGFIHRFDFLIPRSRSKPERLLRAINDPTKDKATLLIFGWTDTRRVRPDNPIRRSSSQY